MKFKFFQKIIDVALLLFASSMFFSCSDSSPEIAQVIPYIVFDYASQDSLPENYLAIFLKMNSDNKRVESLLIKKKSDFLNLEWRISNPEIFSNGFDNFVFSPRLNSTYLQKGDYQITYFDSAGKEINSDFIIEYDDKILNTKCSNLSIIFKEKNEYIALYDENKQLIYLGNINNNWKSDNDIANDKKNTIFKRKIYSIEENNIVCLLPTEKLKLE